MEKLFYTFGLAEKRRKTFGRASNNYELATRTSDREGRTFLYIEDAEVEIYHDLDNFSGEPFVEVASVTNEQDFRYDDDLAKSLMAYDLFSIMKNLLEESDDFVEAAFAAVADEYCFDGKGFNDPEGRWRRVNA